MKLNEDMIQRIELLLEDIRTDYVNFYNQTKRLSSAGCSEEVPDSVRCDMINEFNESLRYEVGQKYVRILQNNRVWGFVVASENDKKFPQGEILKAASYKSPTRNAGRGNLFTEYTIEWTGPQYL